MPWRYRPTPRPRCPMQRFPAIFRLLPQMPAPLLQPTVREALPTVAAPEMVRTRAPGRAQHQVATRVSVGVLEKDRHPAAAPQELEWPDQPAADQAKAGAAARAAVPVAE